MELINTKNIFLLGSKDEYTLLKTWIHDNKNSHLHLNGWYYDKEIPIDSSDLVKKFENMAGMEIVDHFVLDPSDLNPKILDASINWAESKGARVHLIQNSTSTLTKKIERLNRFGPFAAVPLRQEPLSQPKNKIFKKIFDYLLSTFVFFGIFWWFYIIVGVLIKLSGKGPVVIKQNRVGINGLRFKCLKFRTMTSNKLAEKGIGKITNLNDSRVTWIGKILRQTNLDELPQFINVLFGDMSVIGPRPHMLSEDKEIENKIERYRIRRFIKPGITGLAAIRGYRGGTEDMHIMQKRIDYDLEYLENWNLFLDIKIALITFWQMITLNTRGY